MKALLILIFSISFAKNDGERSPSEKECVKNAQDKNAIIKKSQCKWKVTTQIYPDEDPLSTRCNGYEIIDKKRVPKKTTYNGSGHVGTLECNNSDNAIASSYKDQIPAFSFQCSECNTSSEGPAMDDMCAETMLQSEIQYCDGNPKMRFRYEPKQDPIPIDEKGKPLK